MKELRTEIIINATPDQVWKVLTEFTSYGEWNSFMVVEGKLAVGERLKNTMVLNGKTQVFKPIIQKVEENKTFEWLGSLPLGVFKGRHYFMLEELGNNRTKLIHGEKFSGLLHKIILKQIEEATYQTLVRDRIAFFSPISG